MVGFSPMEGRPAEEKVAAYKVAFKMFVTILIINNSSDGLRIL